MKISKLYIYGNRTACSYCRALVATLKDAKFVAWLNTNNISIVDCDKVEFPAAYSANMKVVGYKGGQWPQIFIVSDTKKNLGSFIARKFTATSLIKKIESYCADCSEDTTPDTPPVVVNKCPWCGHIL